MNVAPQLRKAPPLPSYTGRSLPADLNAEGVVLGDVLEAGNLDRVRDIVRTEDFFSEANRDVHAAMVALEQRGATISYPTVVARMRDLGTLQRAGGAAYVKSLEREFPVAIRIEDVARVVAMKARRRAAIEAAHRILAEGFADDIGDEADWLESLDGRMAAATASQSVDLPATMADTLTEVVAELSRTGGVEKRPRLSTGLLDLDRLLLGGLRAGSMTAVGGRWGSGKSALALQIATHIAGHGRSVAIFSVEMSREELAERALFARARVSASKIAAKHTLNEHDWTQLRAAGAQLAQGAPIWLSDSDDLTMNQARGTALRVQREAERRGAPLGLVVIDYLQLLNGRDGLDRSANREQEVSHIAKSAKKLARRLNCPVIAVSQLNGEAAKRGRPTSDDMRESKAIAMHADNVILIHNDAAEERARRQAEGERVPIPPCEPADIIVDKQRGGPQKVTAPVLWFPSCTTFVDCETREYEP